MKMIKKNKLELKNVEFGANYSEKSTIFRVFSPNRKSIKLRLFEYSNAIQYEEFHMKKNELGIWEIEIKRDLDGYFYTYIADDYLEVTDPYSYALSINSTRSAIIDINKTNPYGWEDQKMPYTPNNEAIIYEMSIKDFTYDKSSGAQKRGKFLGVSEHGTSYNYFKTGIDHLIELGITHVHLMPIYDFLTVDENPDLFFEDENYNWGYDPEHFNVPEGSYATRPDDPKNRIIELKTMIMKLHEANIKVIIDVVYNHTYRSLDSNFYTLYPGYYRLINSCFANGSGCGNETNSEDIYFQKFLLDSIKFWIKEYKIDGFRFDLMGLIDIDTMEKIVETAKSLREDILIYGEPWVGGLSALEEAKRTVKGTQKNKGFAVFNDDFRDSIKGSNNGSIGGFINGKQELKLEVEKGISGSINYDKIHHGFAADALESINYFNSHDDLIIADKLKLVSPEKSDEEIAEEAKLAFGIIFTSFGIPFIHSGNEFMRNKSGVSNSFNAPASLNSVKWDLKEKNLNFYNYVRSLIDFRKRTKVFRMHRQKDIKDNLIFLDLNTDPIIAYIIRENKNRYFLIAHNSGTHPYRIDKYRIVNKIESRFTDEKIENLEIIKLFGNLGYTRKHIRHRRDYLFIKGISTEIYLINLEK
ncbi:MAG: type I pullulanase [Tissierellia bacterium]|nr:type I pullulanase [Tissierellia bacterium]